MESERGSTTDALSRRSLLLRTGLATGGLVLGSAVLAGGAAASEQESDGCLRVCWMDVKPGSCPNSVNPAGSGVLPVSAGWPDFEEGTVELIPVKGSYDAAFGDCQDYENPRYAAGTRTAEELRALAASSDRSATPTWTRVEDVDGDGDLDTKFKFDVSDLELESDDTYLVLKGESSTSDCTFFAIDSVRASAAGGVVPRGAGGSDVRSSTR